LKKGFKPYSLDLDFESGEISFYNKKVEIRLSDLEHFVYNTKVLKQTCQKRKPADLFI